MQTCNNHAIPMTPELAEEIIGAIDREGMWGDGQTLEDIVYQKLAEHHADRCPECDRPVQVSEEMLSRISMEMLAHI